jgi:hypothetical protein
MSWGLRVSQASWAWTALTAGVVLQRYGGVLTDCTFEHGTSVYRMLRHEKEPMHEFILRPMLFFTMTI